MILFSERAKELGAILIQSFQDLTKEERYILSNNTFMVASRIKQTFGEIIEEKIKTFTHDDWREAWAMFNGHYYDEEGELEGEDI